VATEDQGSRLNVNKGVLQGLASYLFFSTADALLRHGHGSIPPYQLGFFAGLVGFVTVPFLLAPGDRLIDLVRPNNWLLWMFRGVLGISGTLCAIYCFGHLPLAEAMSIVFLTPLVTTILAATLLKEKVSIQTWLGTLVGLAGVLIVLAPNFVQISIGHVAAVGAGLSGAFSAILTRYTHRSEKPITMFGAATLSLLVFSGVMMVPGFRAPTLEESALIIAIGVMGAVGGTLMLFAWRNAKSADVAPTQYSQLVWGIVIGWLVFHETLRSTTVIGLLVILTSVPILAANKTARGT
jgi:drug/metabolite transporter (DMT)-like permease